jgi:predicted dithiol-disulfide oxidoreductase (DUF899 family)
MMEIMEVPGMDNEKEIAELRAKIADIRRRLPAHSVKPGMLQELEQLEDRLSELLRSP